MADEIPAPEAEIDVDSLDDSAFADLKGKMRSETPAEPPQKPKNDPLATVTAKKDEPAPDSNVDEGDDGEGKKAETVPHQQFHRERERRKAAEARSEQDSANLAKALDRLNQLIEVQTPKQEAPAIPEWTQDPIAAGAWTQQQVLELQKTIAKQQETTQQQTAEQQVLTRVNTALATAIQADPSIKEAHTALRRSMGQELMAVGYTEEQAIAAVNEMERQHAHHIAANNLDVGTYLKALASARGWQAPAAPPPTINDGKSEADKINERERTRLAAQSLGKGGGAVVNTGRLTPEQVLELSDEDFREYKKKHGSVAYSMRDAG